MIAARVEQLEAVFRDIAATRMADVPICHPGLAVRALGFEPLPDEPQLAFGVLLTPWFMNLVRLPLDPTAPAALREREAARRVMHDRAFDFLGAFEPALGPFESCSLYSPMFDFVDQAGGSGHRARGAGLAAPARAGGACRSARRAGTPRLPVRPARQRHRQDERQARPPGR